VRWIALGLGFVWALPTTVLGLLVGAGTFQLPRIHGGALCFDRGPRGVTWLLARFHRSAMTLGFVIVSSAPVEGRLLAHEREHIRQSMVWGPLFVPVYLLLAIPYGYRRHPMERRARRAADADGTRRGSRSV
jgi:hypothetical protein